MQMPPQPKPMSNKVCSGVNGSRRANSESILRNWEDSNESTKRRECDGITGEEEESDAATMTVALVEVAVTVLVAVREGVEKKVVAEEEADGVVTDAISVTTASLPTPAAEAAATPFVALALGEVGMLLLVPLSGRWLWLCIWLAMGRASVLKIPQEYIMWSVSRKVLKSSLERS